MKKKINVFISFLILMIVLFHIVAFSAATEGPYSGGKGTAENPYIISSVEDFIKIPDGSKSEYILVSDITLPSTTKWI